MTTSEQISATYHEHEIELAPVLSQPVDSTQCTDLVSQVKQDHESTGNQGGSRSSLIGSNLQLTATLFALFVSKQFPPP
jgi:hypothetical protein